MTVTTGDGKRVRLVAAALDLEALGLRLPLIDSLLPSSYGLGVGELRMGYLSQNLDDARRQRLAALLPTGPQVPEGVQTGPYLELDALFGGVRHPFGLGTGAPPAPSLTATTADGAAAGAGAAATAWWAANRTFGPVQLVRIGAGYAEGRVHLLVDASVSAGGVELATRGLGVELPLKTPRTPVFHLDGLGLGLDRPPITVAGEFVRYKQEPDSKYALALGGEAVVGTPAVSVTALGFYAQPKDSADPSLFVFGVLDLKEKAIGPPMFRVQALAAGFGYHSVVRTPTITEVSSFPFVTMLDGQQSPNDPLGALDKLLGTGGAEAWVTPSRNGIWLAAGLRAQVYEQVDVSAVAVAQFGDDFVVGLYGRAQAAFPKGSTTPWAQLAVDLRAEYRRSTDTLAIDAVVADGSFILDPACNLRGALAVRLWFGDSAHPGDFIATVGGYHPRFRAPGHYPRVRRLGFDWSVGSGVHVTGNCYAALAPHAFMAGLNASLSGDWGPASVHASVYADALIEWDPLYFDVDWGGSIRAEAGPFSLELSADGRVWGPPVGGRARFKIGWWTVHVDFGSDSGGATVLSADAFRRQMLPAGDGKVVHLAALRGLLPSASGKGGHAAEVWTAARGGFRFGVRTAVPAASVTVNGTEVGPQPSKALHIRPMADDGATPPAYNSCLVVGLTVGGKQVAVNTAGDDESWQAAATSVGVPAALWGAGAQSRSEPGLIDGYATGVEVFSPTRVHTEPTVLPEQAFTVKRFAVDLPSPQDPSSFPPQDRKSGDPSPLKVVADDITSPASARRRTGLLAGLAHRATPIPGFSCPPDAGLQAFARNCADYLDAEPQLVEGTKRT